jgi:cardiolipin synthase
LRAQLQAAGASFAVFLPSRLSPITAPRFNFINHRKILVVDEQVAIFGGMNIADDYRNFWHDIMLQVKGSAVSGLSRILLEDWYFATRELVEDLSPPHPRENTHGTDVAIIASGPDTEPWIHDAYFTAINRARHRLYIATPYFIPTPSILTALRTACGRGVDVRILLPSRSDVEFVQWASRSYYRTLVYAGVRIFEYKSTMIHAKALLVDDEIISVGTANVDNRSFRLNFEVCCFVRDRQLAGELLEWLNAHWPLAREITPDYLAREGTVRRLVESAAHLMSPLL